MDPNGNIYVDTEKEPPEEDVKRLQEWGDGIEKELERQMRKLERVNREFAEKAR